MTNASVVCFQRERKKNYDVNEYYRDVMGQVCLCVLCTDRCVHGSHCILSFMLYLLQPVAKPIAQAKMIRLPQMYDYQVRASRALFLAALFAFPGDLFCAGHVVLMLSWRFVHRTPAVL